MTRTSIHLLVLFLLFSSASCVKVGTTDPEEDSCSKSRQETTAPFTLLTSSNPELYVQTGAPVDIYCHGKFFASVSYADDLRFEKTAPFPPLFVEFGTTFILGSGFKLDTVQESSLDMATQKVYYYWILKADQGAKNLSDEQDWYYTMYFYLNDPTKRVFINSGNIDYKAKKK